MMLVPTAASESRSILETELDWLDSKLSDGRPYLIEDRFSRADLTVASLLALFACPQEISAFRGGTFPDAVRRRHRALAAASRHALGSGAV